MQINKTGSILLEALLSIVILSVSLTLIIQSMTATWRAVVISNETNLALMLLENKMMEIMQEITIGRDMSEGKDFSIPYEKYRYHLKSRPADDPYQEKLNTVTLEVSWNSGQKENNIPIETYLFDDAP